MAEDRGVHGADWRAGGRAGGPLAPDYFRARSIWSGHIYCPVAPPTDLEGDANLTYDCHALPFQQYERSQKHALHIKGAGDGVTMERTGLKSYSALWELKSIPFPWSL